MKSQLKKFIRIYLAAVGGIVGVILAVAVIVEVVDRLKVEDQILLQIPEEADTEVERILDISIFEGYWNDEQTEMKVRLVPMADGVAYESTDDLKYKDTYFELDGQTERYSYKSQSGSNIYGFDFKNVNWELANCT